MNTEHFIEPSPPAPLWNDCPNCSFIAWCTRANLTAHQVRQFGDRIEHHCLRKHHEYLHRIGAALLSLYVINSGFMRTSITDDDGREQITGFSMPGDLVGMEAIATGRYQCDTIALEDSSVCGIAFADFQQLNRDIPALQHLFHRMLGSEIARGQFPAESFPALLRARLFGNAFPPADDAAGYRQLSWTQTGDSESRVFAPRQQPVDCHPWQGCGDHQRRTPAADHQHSRINTPGWSRRSGASSIRLPRYPGAA